MRRRSKCSLCSGHGKREPVGSCRECNADFCDRHGAWIDSKWLCTKCVRQR